MRNAQFKKSFLEIISRKKFISSFRDSKELFLTIDDGPHPEFTPHLLRIFADRKIKATFFLVGKQVAKYPELVKDIAACDHVLFSHTFNHIDLTVINERQFLEDLKSFEEIVDHRFPVNTRIIRPPMGKISVKAILWAFKYNLKFIHYSQTLEDWQDNAREIIQKYHRNNKYRKGDIILYHGKNQESLAMIPELLDNFFEQGFTFREISHIDDTFI